jgi:translation initiation factor 2 subunit 2
MEELPLVDFSKLKKKRRIQKKAEEENDDLSDFMISTANSNTNNKAESKGEGEDNNNINLNPEDTKTSEYTYQFLLDRVYGLIKRLNPDVVEKTRVNIAVPIVNRVGRSRSVWVNFADICNSLNRPMDHLFQFILTELGCEGSIGGENQFLLKNKYNNKHIESLLKKYVLDYVQCTNCKSTKTILKKDNSTRMQVLACTICKSEKTVTAIRAATKNAKK